MEHGRFEARGLDARCNRRMMLRWLGGGALIVVGNGVLGETAGAHPAPGASDPVERGLPLYTKDVSHDTRRIAGVGLAAAAVLVASKLIRDKERDSEL